MARHAAAIRLSDMRKARHVLEDAMKAVPVPSTIGPESLPEGSVLSYIERNLGVADAIESNWEDAITHWTRAIRICPTNATARYLQGSYYQNEKECEEGVESMRRSIALDPDFRSSYIGLANCYLISGEFELAMEACQCCLRRFPDTIAAQFN